MRFLLPLCALAALFSISVSSQNDLSQDHATMDFVQLSHDFGLIAQGDIVTHTFTFTNNGTDDLELINAKGSCGCTVPQWPKEPIPPGGTGTIMVQFDSKGKLGLQRKNVTITTNSSTQSITVLHISAEIVLPEEYEEKEPVMPSESITHTDIENMTANEESPVQVTKPEFVGNSISNEASGYPSRIAIIGNTFRHDFLLINDTIPPKSGIGALIDSHRLSIHPTQITTIPHGADHHTINSPTVSADEVMTVEEVIHSNIEHPSTNDLKELDSNLSATTITDEEVALELIYYPNPFINHTTIAYNLPEDRQVRLRIFSSSGQEIETLVDQFQTAGEYTVQWSGRSSMGQLIDAGQYTCYLETTDASGNKVIHRTGKLIKVR